jgi:hypothetical protein
LDAKYDQVYDRPEDQNVVRGIYIDSDGEGEDYVCANPYDWKGFGVRRAEPEAAQYHWPTVYHGTSVKSIASIIHHGLLAPGSRTSSTSRVETKNGSMGTRDGESVIYTTPSIQYAAKPSYSRVVKYDGQYYQVALQLSQRPGSYRTQRGKSGYSTNVLIDDRFDNDELERLNGDPRDLVIVRILIRHSPKDPRRLWRRRFAR